MNKILFLMTHLGSERSLQESLQKHPDIEYHSSKSEIYSSFKDITKETVHAAMTCVYEVFHNCQLQRKLIFPEMKFIFYLDEPKSSINNIVNSGIEENDALRYYLFRLQGLYEYYVRTNGILITEGYDKDEIESYLELRSPLKIQVKENSSQKEVSYRIAKKAEKAYEDLVRKTLKKNLKIRN